MGCCGGADDGPPCDYCMICGSPTSCVDIACQSCEPKIPAFLKVQLREAGRKGERFPRIIETVKQWMKRDVDTGKTDQRIERRKADADAFR